jgi:uncharacterized metal-binding protein YceD (DUF177 family)
LLSYPIFWAINKKIKRTFALLKKTEMGSKRAFEIAFVGLKQGFHNFEYHVDEQFLIEKGAADSNKLNATVELELEKNSTFLQLKFRTGGNALVNCDRCGNELNVDIWDEFNMLVKLTDNAGEKNEEEVDPDIFYINRTESHIDVSDWLYEFVMLSIPTQNQCGEDENGNSLCNADVLQKLEKMKKDVVINDKASIWKGLEKFKEN